VRCEAVAAPLLQGERLEHARRYRKEVHYALSSYTNASRPRIGITPSLASEPAYEIRSQGHVLPPRKNQAPESSYRMSNETMPMVARQSSPDQQVSNVGAAGPEGRARQESRRRSLGKSGPAAPKLLSAMAGVKTGTARVASAGSIDWSMDDEEGKGKPSAEVGDVSSTESMDRSMDDEEGKNRGEGSGSGSGSGSMPRVLVVTSENIKILPPGDRIGNARAGTSPGEGGVGVDGGENRRRGRRLSFDGEGDGGEGSQQQGRSSKVSSSALGRCGTVNKGTVNSASLPRSLLGSRNGGLNVEIGESTSSPLGGGARDGGISGGFPEPLQSMATPLGGVIVEAVKTDVRGEGPGLVSATNDAWAHSPVKEAKGTSSTAGNHFDDDAVSPPTIIAPPSTPAKGVCDGVRVGAEGLGGVRDLRGDVDAVLEALMQEFESLSEKTEAAVDRWEYRDTRLPFTALRPKHPAPHIMHPEPRRQKSTRRPVPGPSAQIHHLRIASLAPLNSLLRPSSEPRQRRASPEY
jgi:hypothetical protein